MAKNRPTGEKTRSLPPSPGQSDRLAGEKTRSLSPSPGQSDKRADEPAAAGHHLPSPAAIRELIESVAIAFILAFLFRTFEAEAFVIPTGSMAPTLMGRHKDVTCPKCGYTYQVSASDEVLPDGTLRGADYQVVSHTCPMCRYTDETIKRSEVNRDMLPGALRRAAEKDPSYNGDRILVSKLAYELGEPQRWDVIVFKYPGDQKNEMSSPNWTGSTINFIKRLVGLPGDTVRIQNGQVRIKSGKDKKELGDKAEFKIARKPPRKLLAMLQPVFDNDYMPRIAAEGWPVRWYSAAEDAPGDWHSDDLASFAIDGSAKTEKWLRYHHRVPSLYYRPERSLTDLRAPRVPAPQLITDFTAYDTEKTVGEFANNESGPGAHGIGSHWVGDLAVQCEVDVQSPQGALILELRKGGKQFQCRFDLATGRATLGISGGDMADWRRTAVTSVRGQGRHKIIFSNCDDELRLWIDGSLVSFDSPDGRATYRDNLGNNEPDSGDLEPVGVAAAGAAVRISHLRVLRDIYYNADSSLDYMGHDFSFTADDALPGHQMPRSQITPYVDFPLKEDRSNPSEDQFFVLGDNSAMSKDGRLWGTDHKDYWVPRQLLIGKALFIYWPHSWDRLPYFHSIPFPYFPNFSRMRLVR